MEVEEMEGKWKGREGGGGEGEGREGGEGEGEDEMGMNEAHMS